MKNYLRGTYGSTTYLPASAVIAPHPVFSGVEMVILQNTKNFVQAYFNCADTSVGAVLENGGGSGSQGSHWERSVYYNEFMTASSSNSADLISGLTLNFLKDTGYFSYVDLNLADSPYYGKNKGC